MKCRLLKYLRFKEDILKRVKKAYSNLPFNADKEMLEA
jgi:hypothetical protein